MKSNLLKTLLILTAFFGVFTVTGESVNAQGRTRRGSLNKAQVDRLIRNLEERVDRFTAQINDSLDNSRLDGTRREDNINERARELESATDELRREFDRHDTWQENRAEVQKCLNIAAGINRVMLRRRFGRATESNWAAVRAELNALARAYNLSFAGRRI